MEEKKNELAFGHEVVMKTKKGNEIRVDGRDTEKVAWYSKRLDDASAASRSGVTSK